MWWSAATLIWNKEISQFMDSKNLRTLKVQSNWWKLWSYVRHMPHVRTPHRKKTVPRSHKNRLRLGCIEYNWNYLWKMLKAAIYISILYDIHLQFQSKTSLIIKGWMDNFFKHTFPINTSIFKPQCQLFSEIYVCTQSRLKVNVELKELPQNEHMGNTITQAKK